MPTTHSFHTRSDRASLRLHDYCWCAFGQSGVGATLETLSQALFAATQVVPALRSPVLATGMCQHKQRHHHSFMRAGDRVLTAAHRSVFGLATVACSLTTVVSLVCPYSERLARLCTSDGTKHTSRLSTVSTLDLAGRARGSGAFNSLVWLLSELSRRAIGHYFNTRNVYPYLLAAACSCSESTCISCGTER